MEVRIPKQGDIYRHFKGTLYEVVLIARDSETLEEKVVYKEVDGEAAYVRSLSMFVSPVDREKYPDVKQEFRFQYIENSANAEAEEASLEDPDLIMGFLELKTVSEKITYLLKVQEKITDFFLEVVAQSLDFVENEGDLQERYEALLAYLRTVERYEGGRFR